jgi:predicted deacylase
MDYFNAPRPTTAFMTVELDRPGRQVGSIMLPYSTHEDAWGCTPVPIAVLGNGSGPTVIIEAGNHGDEYEGQIVVSELIRDLDPSAITGRLILLPASNVHAAIAGRRTSPVDAVNMNRAFPGDPRGTITRQIAAFIADHILPKGDAFIDLHSGGSSLDIIPSVSIEPASTPQLRQKNIEAGLAFDAPLTVVIANLGEPGTATATACRAGLVTVATEMGGGGTVDMDGLAICRRGVKNVLAHLGVLPPDAAAERRSDGQVLELPGREAFVFSPGEGIFEPFHANGTVVHAGEPAGRVHCPWEPDRAPATLHYAADGLLYARRRPGRVHPGSCCLAVAAPYKG